jgi:hypothetical protein
MALNERLNQSHMMAPKQLSMGCAVHGALAAAACTVKLGHPNLISGFLSTPSPDGSVGREGIKNIHLSEQDKFGYQALIKYVSFCLSLAF